MNTKRLITASIFSLISASTALAADVLIPHQTAPSTPSSTIVAPTFSWTGLYLGIQAGGFSSKSDIALVGQEKSFPLDKEFSPKLSGFAGGFYAGSNIDLGDSFIFGVDTDLMLSGKKHTKTIAIGASDNVTVENAGGRSRRSAAQSQPTSTGGGIIVHTPAAGTGTPAAVQGAGTPAAPGVKAATTATGGGTPAAGGENPTAKPTEGARNASSPTISVSSPVMKPQSGLSSTRTSVSGNGTALTPSSSSGLRSAAAGGQSSGAGASGASSSTKSATTAPATQKASISVQSSAAERAVPSGSLLLARSGPSNSGTGASNGTSGAHSAHHSSSHGSGNSNPHGASHPGGNGSGTNPHGAQGANSHASRPHGVQSQQASNKDDASVYGMEQIKKMASELGLDQEDDVETLNHTFKQNWGGATRVRIGFAADRFMPYLAGGIAYGQFQDTVSVSVKGEDGSVISSRNLTDETKTMIGYTLGGGVDFSVLDNVIVRAEYRYSDFGKKKFAKEKLEINYKTNDFRVGVAYKF
ncbi:porin [Bartonella saheliensis]|uniref:porin n=1 Tax=Bartonella saheliensis TaxID=1457016 RepID=UPI0011A863E9|nr:porin [Bartonella saheliensis]